MDAQMSETSRAHARKGLRHSGFAVRTKGRRTNVTRLLVIGLMAGLSFQGASALAAVELKIVTASARGTYIQIGRDIASIVAPSADIELDVLPSAGSAENVRRLRHEPGVKFAIVQSDVFQAFLDQ